jgi:hypothetical protein
MTLRATIFVLLLLSSFSAQSMHQMYLYANAGNLCAFAAGSTLMAAVKPGNIPQAEFSLLGSMGFTAGACRMFYLAADVASQCRFSSAPHACLMSSGVLSGLAGFFSTALVSWYFDWHKKQGS